MTERVSTKLGREDLIIETGKIAKQADAAVTVQLGGTVVLTTCVCSKEAREGIDFLPLTVEYREKTSAAGKIPGGFFKREGRPSEKEILTARLIDRPIRPLFPKGMVNGIQVVNLVLSSDSENDSDVLAVNGASVALSMSNIPFDGPIGCVRVGLIDGKFILNPTFKEVEESDLDMVVVGRSDKVVMMEAESKELSEEKINEAMEFAQGHIVTIIDLQKNLIKKCGQKKREDVMIRKPSEELCKKIEGLALNKLNEINKLSSKDEREEALNILTNELLEKLVSEENPTESWEVKSALQKLEKQVIRKYILENKKRIDKRGLDEVRKIECEVGILPRTHGSGLFTRGQTQALCTTTLGTSADEQRIDALEGETQKAFMLHYNFPGFSVGEISPFRGPGRREIGHGALAEKALKPVIPSGEKFPYTVRVVSDILESNGSSSMASVCAGSLSLMDAGVPTKAPVAGIAIGLIAEGDKHILLTDIAGVEDHYGDMDFKVAGTTSGITAIQMDLKIGGLKKDVVENALVMAKKARLEILEKMDKAIAKPKEELSDYAPRIVNLKVNPAKIKDVIGPGGRTIKKIISDFGVTIDVEDDGSVQVASNDDEATRKALEVIKGLTADVEAGQIYKGKVTRIMNFGAFCEILPGKEGLVHVSEIANRFVKDVTDELNIGDEVTVKVIEIDQQGRINLSIKQLLEDQGEEDQGRDKKERKR
ncbi:MAG: polyribonucleotide nucleotidyltransferase [Candidatus Omnitrophica bacterium]|nr:polyribonucleotide nucleotidyltransferase [Candidatus Omnitrophota bacterium]